MAKKFRKLTYEGTKPILGADITKIQNLLEEVINPLASSVSSDMKLISNLVTKKGNENLIEHGLGRDYIGCHVVSKDGPLDWYIKPNSTADKARYIPLVFNNDDVNIKLIVF